MIHARLSRLPIIVTCFMLSAAISGCSGEGLTGRLQNLINDVVQQVAEAGGVAEAVDAATGGTVSDPEKGVEVVVPAGALPEPAEGDAWVVAIKPYSEPAPEDPESYEAAGEIVDISIVSALNGTAAKLLAAINITVPYGSAVTDGDVDRLAVGNYHDGTWITAKAEQVDTERRRVTAKFSQLSPFRAMLATGSGAAANATPVAKSAQFSVNEDETLTGQLTGSDADGDTLSFELVDDVAHGTVTVETSGAFTYRPVADYNG
ncbi:MAG: hypothetical protein D6761_07915, partial [Candidatus Dadabacteria bacterium]